MWQIEYDEQKKGETIDYSPNFVSVNLIVDDWQKAIDFDEFKGVH